MPVVAMVLVVIDKVTKYVMAILVSKEIDTLRFLDVLNKENFLYFGLPKHLISD